MNINKKIITQTITSELHGDIDGFRKELLELEKLDGCKYPMIDCHIHVVDFTQKTQGLKSLLHYMDRSNIEAWVIFWLSVIKTWWESEKNSPEYYLDDDNACYYYSSTDAIVASEYLSLSKKEQKRFYPLLCGFNPMDLNSVDHIKRTFLMYPWVFYGVGEVFYRHDDLTHMTYGEPPRMNTLATKKLFEFLSEYDLPLCIHNNITTPWISDYPKFLHELEEVIAEFPKTKVVLCHCGASRRLRAPYYPKMIARLLREYPGLYVDYAWVVFEEIINESPESLKEWVELSEEFSSRIMIGSDVLWNAFEQIGLINSKYNPFLDQLTPETREKICRENVKMVYGKSRNHVELERKRVYPKLKDLKK